MELTPKSDGQQNAFATAGQYLFWAEEPKYRCMFITSTVEIIMHLAYLIL